MRAWKVLIFPLAAVLLCIAGVLAPKVRWLSISMFIIGAALLAIAVLTRGGRRPSTALTLLVTANLSFCASFGLILLNLLLRGPAAVGIRSAGGAIHIDSLEATEPLWTILLALSFAYELVVFIRALTSGQSRIIAVVGIALAVVFPVAEVFVAKMFGNYLLDLVLNGV